MTSHQFDLTSTPHYARQVRTTLRIDDDVLEAAVCIAVDTGLDVGEILSRLARRGLEPHPAQRARAGFPGSAASAALEVAASLRHLAPDD